MIICEICGDGYGKHYPIIDEDLNTEGLLRGAPAPNRDKAVPKRRKTNKLYTNNFKNGFLALRKPLF